MRINPEFDYNDTKNNYKIPYNNSVTYDEFIKNNKHAPQHIYYKGIGEQLNHIYVSKKKNNEAKTDNNDDKNSNNNNDSHHEVSKKDNKSSEVNKTSFERLGNESPIMTLSTNNENENISSEHSVVVEQLQQTNNNDQSINKSSGESKIQNNENSLGSHQINSENINSTTADNKSDQCVSYHHEHNSQRDECGYYFVYNYDHQNKSNDYYEPDENGETFEEARLRVSKEQGFLNGYLPNKYQGYIESVENPMYFDRDIKQNDVETQRRLNKIVHDPLKESIENSLVRQYDDLYKEKEERDRQRLYNKVNRIRYDGIENWEDFVSLNAFTSKLKENYIPRKMTEKQKVNEDNIYFGVYPIQHKRPGEEPPFDKEKINKETPLRFLADYGIEFDKGVMKCREPPFEDCNCWINETSKQKTEQPLPYLYASRNIKFNELKSNTYISPNLQRLLEQDYRNTGKIGPKNQSIENNNKNTQSKSNINSVENSNISSPSTSSTKNKIQFYDNSYINKDDLNDLIINQKDNSSTTVSKKPLAPVKAPKRITCRDRSHNYVIYDYESAKAKVRNNNRIKNLAAKQKIYKSSIDILG
ncbi:hypothetical protein PIROE2DRAFT_3660 [Piromyces sp. E2]|nr:hypothetical protein PIROE2DRAFT_3660 [Piromyces sp. E2]|eukprot:OUM68663.1 hypothetical protein PIROE2DRAFT_3660 [Piromyces sp. E2]